MRRRTPLFDAKKGGRQLYIGYRRYGETFRLHPVYKLSRAQAKVGVVGQNIEDEAGVDNPAHEVSPSRSSTSSASLPRLLLM